MQQCVRLIAIGMAVGLAVTGLLLVCGPLLLGVGKALAIGAGFPP